MLHHLASNLLVRELAAAIATGRVYPGPFVRVCAGSRLYVLAAALRALDLDSSKHAPLTSTFGVVPMAEAYTNTISGLLRKRSELMGDAQRGEELAHVGNDIEALDRAYLRFNKVCQ